uniref:Aminotransferase-like plant mobile domain-containing protein n=1 Tax=Quercus lobata TaxID=97700 RepID=A0A7N2MJ75_QUELO
MAAANAGQINHAQPGPIDTSVLTLQPNHRSEAIWNGQDPGSLKCRARSEEFSNREPMVDDRVIDIIKALGLEGLLRTPGREIDHGLITALVKRWRPETHTFHMPHGEVTITLQDVEVLLGLPVDGDVVTGSTQKEWENVCDEYLGFRPTNEDHLERAGQRILIKRLLEQVAHPLPPNAEDDEVHRYARCYILALLGDTIFMDKSGDRVHLMASDKKASQIGGCLLLVQYWAWARFPFLCPAVERGPPVGAYGPPVRGPLSLKWVWVPNKKNRHAQVFRDRYREQIALMLPNQVVWQPYEDEYENLPPWCVAGRAVWTAIVPLVCFHLVEKHTPDRVVRQFGMIQEIPHHVNTDPVLHAIDLRGKMGVDWMRRHAMHLTDWGHRLQRRCEAVLGDMPLQHEYFDWFTRITRRFIDFPGARFILMIEGYVRMMRCHPVGTEEHNDIINVLEAVHEIGRVRPREPEAPNEEAATPAAAPTQRPSTTESPSTSTAPAGRCSRPPVATPQVVPTLDPSPSTAHPSLSPTIPSPTPHPSVSPTIPSPTSHPSPTPTIPLATPHESPSPTIPPPTPHESPSPTIPPPTPHACPGSDIRPPTPWSFPELSPIPSFDLGLDQTPPDLQQDPPSHSTSTGPPHVQPEHPVGLAAAAEGRPKRISKAPPCGTGGHKHGHNAGPEASDEGHARPPPYYTRKRKVKGTVGTLAGGRYSCDVWHVFLKGDFKHMLYGYKFDGKFSPAEGLYYDSSRILLDPYAKELMVIAGPKWPAWNLLLMMSAPTNNFSFNPDGSAVNPGAFQQHIRSDSNLMAQLFQNDPELAQAVLGNDLNKLQDLLRERHRQKSDLRRQQEEELALLYADPFDVEAQKKIEAAIRQKGIDENWAAALEHNPDAFARVVMLYVDMEVNGFPLKVLKKLLKDDVISKARINTEVELENVPPYEPPKDELVSNFKNPIIAPDRSKLPKRHGATSAAQKFWKYA